MAEKMSPAERMQAVMMGQKPDVVPVIPFELGYAAQITGISLGDFYADGDKCFEAQFYSMLLHGFAQTPMYGYASCGPYEFGGEIGFPYGKGHSAPYVKRHPVMSLEDIDNLEVPTFDGPELPGAYGEADKVAAHCAKMGMPVCFQIGSVFTAASVVAETSQFLKWVYKEPKAVNVLLDKVAEMFSNAVDYFVEKYGAEHLMPFDGGPVEANTILSPKKFEEIVYPQMYKMHKKVIDAGVNVLLMHPCADQNLNIPYYVKMREAMDWKCKYAWVFGPETTITDQIAAFGDHDIICGNVDPPSLQNKSLEEIDQLCKENIEEGKNSPSGFIHMAGCEFPPLASPHRMMAFVNAAEKYGRYD